MPDEVKKDDCDSVLKAKGLFSLQDSPYAPSTSFDIVM